VRILIIFVLNCMLLCVIRLPFKNLNCWIYKSKDKLLLTEINTQHKRDHYFF
jgi:hypothetical protein